MSISFGLRIILYSVVLACNRTKETPKSITGVACQQRSHSSRLCAWGRLRVLPKQMASPNTPEGANRYQMSALQTEDYIQPEPISTAQTIQTPNLKNASQADSRGPSSVGNPAIVPVKNPLFVTPLDRLREVPDFIDCPFCKRRTQTRVTHENSNTTRLAGVICCLLTGIICSCLPCLLGWCQDTNHYCSECNNQVTHKPYDGAVIVKHRPAPALVASQYAYQAA